MEKTTSEGLLETPAMVLLKYHHTPVFETDPKKGMMLITENLDYIKKNLPKYVPQLFVVSLSWNRWAPQANIATVLKQHFPFEKLQAMLDK